MKCRKFLGGGISVYSNGGSVDSRSLQNILNGITGDDELELKVLMCFQYLKNGRLKDFLVAAPNLKLCRLTGVSARNNHTHAAEYSIMLQSDLGCTQNFRPSR